MMFSGVFAQRLRGFRIVDLTALGLALALAFGGYAFKTLAGAQAAQRAAVQGQIDQEQKRIRLLQAEIAHLEAPSRIERLSTQYLGLQAVDPKQEITPESLPEIALRGVRPAGKPGATSAIAPGATAEAAAKPGARQ